MNMRAIRSICCSLICAFCYLAVLFLPTAYANEVSPQPQEPLVWLTPTEAGVMEGGNIRLDGNAIHGERTMPVPVFPHMRHVSTLFNEGKSCASCHELAVFRVPENTLTPHMVPNQSPFSFRAADTVFADGLRGETPSKGSVGIFSDDIKKHFHANCIPCHEERARLRMKAGPLADDCRSCHRADAAEPEVFQSGYDKALHYAHISSRHINPVAPARESTSNAQDTDANCGACHAMMVPPTGERIWVPGTEDSCRACHLPRQERNHLFKAVAQGKEFGPQAQSFLQRPSLEEAMHTNCIGCHIADRAKRPLEQRGDGKQRSVGPVTCIGCHNPAFQEAMQTRLATASNEPLSTGQQAVPVWAWAPAPQCVWLPGTAQGDAVDAGGVPRLLRGQADAVLLTAPRPSDVSSGSIAPVMPPVSFNHAFHEGKVNTCRSCHHAGIAACSTCHMLDTGNTSSTKEHRDENPLAGRQELASALGKPPVSLYTALHTLTSSRSCQGCHEAVKEQTACKGCHASLPAAESQPSCSACHQMPFWEEPEGLEGEGRASDAQERQGLAADARQKASIFTMSTDDAQALAAREAAKRREATGEIFMDPDIPDVVHIRWLQSDYAAVRMPHKAIVRALLDGQEKSRLAGVFHDGKGSLCQTCHHNSPGSITPPRCMSCHPASGSKIDGRLPLKIAYHQRCFGCHEGIQQKPKPTDCQGCHAVSAQPVSKAGS